MDLIIPFEISGFNEILLLLIVLDFMKSCEILWIYEIQEISVEIWWTSGGFQIMQILFRFTICRFQCGLHYGFHLWLLWISYESTLFHMKDKEKGEESHLNQLFLLISGGFHEVCQISV